jgi:hypothetical protein
MEEFPLVQKALIVGAFTEMQIIMDGWTTRAEWTSVVVDWLVESLSKCFTGSFNKQNTDFPAAREELRCLYCVGLALHHPNEEEWTVCFELIELLCCDGVLFLETDAELSRFE